MATQDYIRLRPLSLNELPPQQALGNTSSTVQLQPLVSTILSQGLKFVDEEFSNFTRKNLAADSKPSLAQVEVLSLEREKETWFARRSKHANAPTEGSASWEEFDGVLRVQHAKNEMNYTPDVIDAYQVCEWSGPDLQIEGWENVTCEGM